VFQPDYLLLLFSCLVLTTPEGILSMLFSLNSATLEELRSLPGVGESRGRRLFAYLQECRGKMDLHGLSEASDGEVTLRNLATWVVADRVSISLPNDEQEQLVIMSSSVKKTSFDPAWKTAEQTKQREELDELRDQLKMVMQEMHSVQAEVVELKQSNMVKGEKLSRVASALTGVVQDLEEEDSYRPMSRGLESRGATAFPVGDYRKTLAEKLDRVNAGGDGRGSGRLDEKERRAFQGRQDEKESQAFPGRRDEKGAGEQSKLKSSESAHGSRKPKTKSRVSRKLFRDMENSSSSSGSSSSESEESEYEVKKRESSSKGLGKGKKSIWSDGSEDSDPDLLPRKSKGGHMWSDNVRRARSPPPPKMDVFGGKSAKWRAFIYCFEETAKIHGWRNKKKLHHLTLCLREKAMEFFHTRPLSTRESYRKLVKALHKRYGQQDPPSAIRRRLAMVKQEETETIEDFADRVLELAMEGFSGMKDTTVQSLALDYFFRGCRERGAAVVALEKECKTVYEAAQAVRRTVHNQRMLGKSAVNSAWQVSFWESGEDNQEFAVQSVAPVQAFPPAWSKEIGERINASMEAALKKMPTSNRDRSASPGRQSSSDCFRCGKVGHYARDCAERPRESCQLCGKVGHMAKDCFSRNVSPKPSTKVLCQLCENSGHSAKECLSKRQSPRAKAPSVSCQLCGKGGHIAKDCWAGRPASPHPKVAQILNESENLNE
jgi:hypothetical protein